MRRGLSFWFPRVIGAMCAATLLHALIIGFRFGGLAAVEVMLLFLALPSFYLGFLFGGPGEPHP